MLGVESGWYLLKDKQAQKPEKRIKVGARMGPLGP
jgi:hypothetical protein